MSQMLYLHSYESDAVLTLLGVRCSTYTTMSQMLYQLPMGLGALLRCSWFRCS